MLANIPRNVLLFLLVSIFVIAIVIIAGGTIWEILKARKNNSHNKKKMILLSILAIFIAAVSWILNMGWIRFIMTFMLIPFIHAIVLFITNFFAASYIEKSPKMKKLNLFFVITYLVLYIFLPDGGDVGGLYFFFGLIHNDALSYIAEFVSGIAFTVHVVLFVLQIAEMRKIKKEKSVVTPMPPWDEIVAMLYGKNLDCFHDEVVKVIYSKDKAMRYVILKNTKGFFAYHLEKIYQFDEEEWNCRCGFDLTPAFWNPVDKRNKSVFQTLEDVLEELEQETEYKNFFKKGNEPVCGE